MAYCLAIPYAAKFLAALRDGTIDPAKLAAMSSEERRAFFEPIVGKDDAREVNALLESKLLLKDQQRGMVSWAKRLAGISEPTRRDLISRIERMDKVLGAADEHAFLADLAAKRLGTEITFDEAQTIADMSKQVSDAKAALSGSDGSPARLDYGAKYVALQNYVHELTLSNADTFRDIAAKAKTNPLGALGTGIRKLAGIAKGLKASFDNSYGGRQGFRAIFTNPTIWARDWLRSFAYMGKQLVHKPSDNSVMDAIKADIFSRQNAVDDTYRKMKLDVGLDAEEAYPETLPEKIPGIGRLYKASEVAYNGMAMRLRADIADHIIAQAKANNHDLTDPTNIESLGRLVNSLTGRGHLGSLEKIAPTVNALFFSPRSLKASFDFLTLHSTDKMSAYSRRLAAINLLRVVAGIASIFGIAYALDQKSVELDPRSADFGKIRIGNTRFDVSGGMSSLVTLAARLVTMSSKSSVTHQVKKLNSGRFGAQTGWDVVSNFATNKASPLASVVLDILRGEGYNHKPLTLAGEASNLLVPLPITNVQELIADPYMKAHPGALTAAVIADALGISTNTYSGHRY